VLSETRAGKPPVRVTAKEATLTGDRENVYFKGQVRAVREATRATGSEPASGPMTLTTEFLHVMPNQEIARTDKAVTITDPRGIINATGLDADSKAKTIKFNSGVSGHMEPRK
jgi:lipopolysaccharide export system protein LptC